MTADATVTASINIASSRAIILLFFDYSFVFLGADNASSDKNHGHDWDDCEEDEHSYYAYY